VPPAPLHSLAARPVSAAADTPVAAGLPGHIRRVGGRTPRHPRCGALRCAYGRALCLGSSPAGFRGLCVAPCLGFGSPPTLAPSPCSPPAAGASSVCCAQRRRFRPPPGAPDKPKPQPGQAESQCSSGAGSMRSRPSPPQAPGGSQARQPGPRPPRCWPRSCHLARKTGWAGGSAGHRGAPAGRGGAPAGRGPWHRGGQGGRPALAGISAGW